MPQSMVGAEIMARSEHSYKLNESKIKNGNSMKVKLFNDTARMAILSSLTVSFSFLALPSPSMADREYVYRNCAELQKVINDYNPRLTVSKFEKVKMVRRSLGYESYTIFCNSGIIVDREVGTVCRGYIGYSFSRIGGGADYYVRWGRTDGSPNFNDTGVEKYCRLIK
jgi:hypothetical protein